MLQTEVRKALAGYEYTSITQNDGVVVVYFKYILSQTEKDLMKQALKTLIHKGTCNKVYVSLYADKEHSFVTVEKGKVPDAYPYVFYEGI